MIGLGSDNNKYHFNSKDNPNIFFFFNFRQRRETIQTCRILIQNRVRSRMIKNLHCLLRFVLLFDFFSTHNFCFNLIFVRQDYKRVLHCFADLASLALFCLNFDFFNTKLLMEFDFYPRQDYKRVLHCFADLVSSHCGWLRLLRRRISWCHLQSSSNQLWSD